MKSRNAFTLIELVVVVMIIGIIAAIVTPKLVGLTGTSTDNSARQTLTVLRSAIDTYASQNSGTFPTLSGSGANTFASTYLRSPTFPNCVVGPVAGTNTIETQSTGVEMSGAGDGTTAWKFDTSSGEIIINNNNLDHAGVKYSTY
jgi:prepilin-type N-terminal cleavage/methylation domain-containing protein